ncbi:MAG: NAD(P)/FAD-dependent oxidoreductase [Flavobacterium sp.]
MENQPDVLIVGGGLAGLTAGLHLRKKGLRVTIIEKEGYPRHKVCGEYVSNEIIPYLKWLGVDVGELNPVKINRFEFSSNTGKKATAKLPLGGFGISRYALDNYLYVRAKEAGCMFVEATATAVDFEGDTFTVATPDETFSAKIVIGAYGKRAGLDQQLSRNFFVKKSPWLAVKCHYECEFPDDVVSLHNFEGGYCGVSKVEDGHINVCYLADYKTFKRYKNIDEYQNKVLSKNPHLRDVFERWSTVFNKPLTISQISFEKKNPVENHILMTGDTAGLIHPLCGNGMAMAIHSAKIASELIFLFYAGTIRTRAELEKRYAAEWKKNFGKRIKAGRMLGYALQHNTIARMLSGIVSAFPAILPFIIKQTHGKPIQIAQ